MVEINSHTSRHVRRLPLWHALELTHAHSHAHQESLAILQGQLLKRPLSVLWGSLRYGAITCFDHLARSGTLRFVDAACAPRYSRTTSDGVPRVLWKDVRKCKLCVKSRCCTVRLNNAADYILSVLSVFLTAAHRFLPCHHFRESGLTLKLIFTPGSGWWHLIYDARVKNTRNLVFMALLKTRCWLRPRLCR